MDYSIAAAAVRLCRIFDQQSLAYRAIPRKSPQEFKGGRGMIWRCERKASTQLAESVSPSLTLRLNIHYRQ
jgi:hypothetical protein